MNIKYNRGQQSSHDPIFGFDFFPSFAQSNVDSRPSLNLSKNRIRRSDRVNQPL